MLHLATETDPAWLRGALLRLDELLIDHAHCEKKAASTAINLIFRYVDQAPLVAALSPLAREELEHFEQVLGLLGARGLVLRRLEPAPYAARLHAAVRPAEPDRLLDTLLCCALIEARSCERMTLLAQGLAEQGELELADFYRSLLASEARHFSTYTDLAAHAFGREPSRARLAELAVYESACLVHAPGRLHG